MNIFLENQVKALKKTLDRQAELLEIKKKQIEADEARIRQGLVKVEGAKDLKTNLDLSLPSSLVAGNVGDINKVIWPFFFACDKLELAPNTNGRTSYTVTQEAGFVWMSLTKVVYLKNTMTNALTYIDPDDHTASGEADGLSITIRDAQSTRQFHDKPVMLDTLGNPRFPHIVSTPYFLLPRGTFELSVINSHATNTYVTSIAFFGYRLRINDAENILSTVFA